MLPFGAWLDAESLTWREEPRSVRRGVPLSWGLTARLPAAVGEAFTVRCMERLGFTEAVELSGPEVMQLGDGIQHLRLRGWRTFLGKLHAGLVTRGWSAPAGRGARPRLTSPQGFPPTPPR